MPLDPEAVAWLHRLAELGVPRYDEVSVEQARRMQEDGVAAISGVPEPVHHVAEVDAGGIPARLYEPAGALPGVLVWLHGGGWVIGSLATHDPLCRSLANRSGTRVISADYRLAPEHPHPAPLDDAWAVAQWAVERYGRVVVGGDSAGAHLAAVVARRARDRGLRLLLQVLVVPVTDCGFDTEWHRAFGQGYGLDTSVMRWFWEHYVPGLEGADDPDVSPLRAANLGGVASALVLTAECDPLRDEGEAYARLLAEAGVDVEHTRYDGMIHGFLRMAAVLDGSATAVSQIAAAVRRALLGDAMSSEIENESVGTRT